MVSSHAATCGTGLVCQENDGDDGWATGGPVVRDTVWLSASKPHRRTAGTPRHTRAHTGVLSSNLVLLVLLLLASGWNQPIRPPTNSEPLQTNPTPHTNQSERPKPFGSPQTNLTPSTNQIEPSPPNGVAKLRIASPWLSSRNYRPQTIALNRHRPLLVEENANRKRVQKGALT